MGYSSILFGSSLLLWVYQAEAQAFMMSSTMCDSIWTRAMTPVGCTRKRTSLSPRVPRCCVSIDRFIEARAAPGNIARPNNEYMPPWLNLQLARRGQTVATEYLAPFLFSLLSGLLFELNMPDVREVLLHSGKNFNHTMNAKRDIATLAQAIVWFGDIWKDSPSKDPNSSFVFSMKQVRNKHINAAWEANNSFTKYGYINDPVQLDDTPTDTELWDAFEADLEASDIPQSQRGLPPSHWNNVSVTIFNQQAMGFVLYNLFAYPILFPRELAFPACREDLWAFNHLFAVFGYALGIEDKYNMALHPNLHAAEKFYEEIFETYIIPGLFHFDKPTHVLMENLFGGAKLLSSGLITPRLILYRFLKNLVKIDPARIYSGMNLYEKIAEDFLTKTLDYLLMMIPPYRTGLNMAVKIVIFIVGNSQFPGRFTSMDSLARNCWV